MQYPESQDDIEADPDYAQLMAEQAAADAAAERAYAKFAEFVGPPEMDPDPPF